MTAYEDSELQAKYEQLLAKQGGPVVVVPTPPPAPTTIHIGAQEKYAQGVLDYLYAHQETACDFDYYGMYYLGSLHMLVRRLYPKAHDGKVVEVLLRYDSVIKTDKRGRWLVNRQDLFRDREGVTTRVPQAVVPPADV